MIIFQFKSFQKLLAKLNLLGKIGQNFFKASGWFWKESVSAEKTNGFRKTGIAIKAS